MAIDHFLTGPQSDEHEPDMNDPIVRMLLGLHPDPEHVDVPDDEDDLPF